ncbi:MAG: acetyl-CoA carboxylase, carboxyltransferase subunit beta [Bacillota bacterium]
MLKDLFGKSKYVTVKRSENSDNEQDIDSEEVQPEEKEDNQLWTKCPGCSEIIFNKKLVENLMVCPKCNHHLRLTARDRLHITVDEDTFIETETDIFTEDALEFPGYKDKLSKARIKTGLEEAVITGEGRVGGYQVVVAVMDFNFMGGSMGSVVGEKITRTIEKAMEEDKPLIIVSTAGGARMQEGMLSLMQMAKTSSVLKRFHKQGNLFISLITDPTSGGVTASFASLGDIILAEKGSLIAFAGPRVIKQTISTKLPEGFQRAEFLLEHGMIDRVVERHQIKDELATILKIHRAGVN